MVAGFVVFLWDILVLAVAFGPIGIVFARWEREDRSALQFAIENRLPLPVRSGRDKALRWAIGLAVFVASAFVAKPMYDISPVIWHALKAKGY